MAGFGGKRIDLFDGCGAIGKASPVPAYRAVRMVAQRGGIAALPSPPLLQRLAATLGLPTG